MGGWGSRNMRTWMSKAAARAVRQLALLPLPLLAAVVSSPAHAADPLIPLSGVYDIRILLTLGITLGIIAFSIGSALACLRATQAALRARDAATLEAERYLAKLENMAKAAE